MKILGAVLELQNKQHCQSSPFTWAGLAVVFFWQLQSGSRDFDFSIAMAANYTVYVKTIETHAHTFLTLNFRYR